VEDAFALRAFKDVATRERELLAMQAATHGSVPIARPRAVGTWQSRPAMLLDWVVGRPLLDLLQSSPMHVLSSGVAFGRAQRGLHAVRAPAALRGTWQDWPKPTTPEIKLKLAAVPMRMDRLLHLDYHPLNVIVDGTTLAIIDWTNAHRGDPRADFARTLTILRHLPLDASRQVRLAQRVFELAWRLGYGPPGPSMDVFYAWAGQAMLHDLAHRHTPEQLAPIRLWTDAQLG
jgi:aminoglycoside phosphotransferase (APT) family kinase protein